MLPTYIFFKKWWSKIEIFGLEQSYGRREYIAKHFDDNAFDLYPMYMHYVEETICCNMVDSWLCIDVGLVWDYSTSLLTLSHQLKKIWSF